MKGLLTMLLFRRAAHSVLAFLLAALALALAPACSGKPDGGTGAASDVAVDVRPPAAQIVTGESVVFAAGVTGTANTSVTWSVQEGAAGGTVDGTGLYTAPSAQGTFHVVATSAADATKSAAATVTVAAAAPPPPTSGASCAGAPLRAGPVYYFCDCGTGADPGCRAGDDANAGTSPSAPRRTMSAAVSRFNGMAPGGTVALCRGGAWDGGGIALTKDCGAPSAWPSPLDDATACDFRDYVPAWGSASTAKPRINAGSANGFDLGSLGRGARIWNLDIRHTNRGDGAGNGPRSFFFGAGGPTYLDLCGNSMDGGYYAIQGAGNNLTPHVLIRGNTVTNFGWGAVLVGSSDTVVDGNRFINNGDQNTNPNLVAQAHNVYFGCASSTATQCTGARVTNNYFRQDPNGSWPVPGGGFGNSCILIMRGYEVGTVVENNVVIGNSEYPACGISFSEGGAMAQYTNAAIRRNRVYWLNPNVHSPQMLQVDGCINCVIEDNLIDNAGGGWGIVAPQDSNGLQATSTGTIVRNNTVRIGEIGCGNTGEWCGGDHTQGEGAISVNRFNDTGTGWIVENNAVYTTGLHCIDISNGTNTGLIRNVDNYCHDASHGTEALSQIWADATNGDQQARNYHPALGGPLVGGANQSSYSPTAIGTVQWSATDAGQTRTPPADIGAYQH